MNTMKTIGTVFAVAVGSLYGSSVYANEFTTHLSGFKEVPVAIFTPGAGKLRLKLDKHAGTLDYELSYSNLTSPVTQAHIHFGQRGVAGGILTYFCSNLGNAPAGTPPCPENGGTVTGTITPAAVLGIQPQNVKPGDIESLLAALFSKTAYANVHTTNYPAGEIRGEIRKDKREHDRDDGRDKENDENAVDAVDAVDATENNTHRGRH
jgi:hypothetical protein